MFTTLLNTMNLFGNVLDTLSNTGNIAKDFEYSDSDMEMIRSNGSMTEFLSTFVIEPTIVVSKSLREDEITSKIIETNIDIFTGLYTQTFMVMTNVHGYKASVAFDMLSSKSGAVLDEVYKPKSFVSRLPSLEKDDSQLSFLPIKPETEEWNVSIEKSKQGTVTSKKSDKKGNTDVANYIVKQIEMDISLHGKDVNGKSINHSVIIPITIKANIIYTDFENIERMSRANDRNKDFSTRWDMFLSGEISFWKDLIFASDLIKEYKQDKLKDKEDLIGRMLRRGRAAKTKISSSYATGFNKYYGILIVNEHEKRTIENNLGGKFVQGDRYKEKFLEQINTLMLNVVDKDWERVQIFTKDIAGHTDVGYKDFKKKSSKDDNISDILKTVLMGKAPMI